MDKMFITGASGFIGKNVIEYFSKDYEIIAYSRNQVDFINCKWIQGDILDQNKLIESMQGCKIVLHLAAITAYNDINLDPTSTFRNYIIGTINVLEAMKKTNADIFIYPSSGKVYGSSNKLPYSESDPPHPTNTMGKAKLEVENIINLYSNIMNNNCKFIIFRIFNAYGYGQSSKFLIPKIINNLNSSKLKLGNTNIKRDYIYIDDILSAIKLVLLKAPAGCSIYNLGSGTPISIMEIIKTISNISGQYINVVLDASQTRSDESDVEFADITKLSSIGWCPQKNLTSGLSEVLLKNNLKNNMEEI